MDTKLVFAIVLAVVLIVFIFMIDSNSMFKGLISNVYGIQGQINTEMFESGSDSTSGFVPAYDETDMDNTYEDRGSGPSSPDNFDAYSPMSAYDGVSLGRNGDAIANVMDGQTKAKNRVASISTKPVITLLGSGAPPAHEMRPAGPDPYQTLPVDGKPGSPKSMFIFANNAMSTDCCPSQYTSDLGCVCLTPEQKDMMSHRGGNRVGPTEY